MDKNINTFAMRLKEWFSWHFPELKAIVSDNGIYAKCVHLIQTRENINDEMKEALEEITLDEDKSQQIIDAAKTSMGQEISEAD
jgi:nucleolar protein 56